MEYEINYQAIIQQLKDAAMIDFIASFAPDDKSKKRIRDIMGIFAKNGIPVDTAVKITSELCDILNKEENE